MQYVAQVDPACGLPQAGPVGEPEEAVDGVAFLGLAQRRLMLFAFPGVPAVAQPVGPGDQRLATGAGGHLVLGVPVEELTPVGDVGPQPSTDFDDGDAVVAMHDRVLAVMRSSTSPPGTSPGSP
jgi:hypothetical protein